MWKYEDYTSLAKLILDLQKDGFHLAFFPETTTEYGAFIATKENFHKVEIDFEYDRIVSIDSNIRIYDDDEDDIPEYDNFDAIHDGSYLPD